MEINYGKWRRRVGCVLAGILVAIVGFLSLPSICVVAGYRDKTEQTEGRVFITAQVRNRRDIAALDVLLDAETNYCGGDCEAFDALFANCGTKKSLELEARMKKIRDEMAFSFWSNLEEGSAEYERMEMDLKTTTATSFLASQLDDEEEAARGPILYIKKAE